MKAVFDSDWKVVTMLESSSIFLSADCMKHLPSLHT